MHWNTVVGENPSPHDVHLYEPAMLMQFFLVSGPHGEDKHSSTSKQNQLVI
jgi:hypothetical protein